jgi:diguanylate cyclase (GGDEF)-like protein/PAS domain S-box-containing protein
MALRKGGAVAEQAEWIGQRGFVPVSLDLQDAGPVAPGYPLTTVAAEQILPLPEAPALVCDGGVVVQANLAAARLAGRRLPELLIGISLDGLLVDYGSDAELIRADGRSVPVRVVRWRVPGTSLLAVFLVDVSDLHPAGDAMRDHELAAEFARLLEIQKIANRRFADLMAISPLGVGIFDDTERLVEANDALCELLGYPLETLRGMMFELLTHPDECCELWRPIRTHETGAGGRPVPQRRFVRSDGAAVYCELHVSVSVQDDGQRFLLVVFADVTERRRVAQALEHQATHDELTGLPNRGAIKDTLAEQLVAPDLDLAVLCCDIDNFKRVNDSLGHDAGDELLVALARRLADGLPACCTVGRLSGDVFVVICSDVTGHGDLPGLTAMVLGLLRTAVPVHGQLVRVSAAIGVAVPDASAGGPEDLLRFADAALSQAKRQSTGQVALANAALMASADRQVELECQLREALLHDGLLLHYQPVVGPDGAVRGAEALERWPHPERGMLAPEVFLPVAEQGGLMRELDCWVLRTALRAARDWVSTDGHPVTIAVNLSGLVPGEPDFVATVATAVAESGMPWGRVVLELVETALVDLPCRTRKAMAELVDRGVRFAVDDFGTGYSSLARLKELPAQIVKVDRRFVSGVGVDPSDFAVARAVVDMARAMGRCCIAEGVETTTQFQVLRGLGVDAYQGWLFSRAVGEQEFRALLGLGTLL